MGIAGEPVQVRNHGGAGVVTSAGPYLRSELPIAGFGLIEAFPSRMRLRSHPVPPAPLLTASSRYGRSNEHRSRAHVREPFLDSPPTS